MPVLGRRSDRVEQHYGWAVEAFRSVAGSKDEYRLDEIARVFDKLEKKYRPSSVNYIFKVCKSRVDGWPRDARYRYSMQDVRQMTISVDSLKKLVDAASRCPDRTYAAYLAMSMTYGMRAVELASIQNADIDIPGERAFIRTAKGGVQRWQLMPEQLKPWLTGVEFNQPSKQQMNAIFRYLESLAGIEHVEYTVWHAIRRTLVTKLAKEAGLAPMVAGKFFRWADAGTHDHYVVYDFDIDRQVFKVHPFIGMLDVKEKK